MADKIVVALGGNALIRRHQRGTIIEQVANLTESLAGVVELIKQGHQLVVTHGNGPQVGNILIRAEEAKGKAYPLPLDVCVAESQGEMGYLIEQTLQNLLHLAGIDRPVVTVLSRVVVDKNDPRMRLPTKPIGPFYSKQQADEMAARGIAMVEDAHRGYRRVVPSPMPLRIVEQDVIKCLFESGTVVIAVGGGGIPVYVADDGTLAGVEAVVDKDLASSVLATAIGADRFLNVTAVEKVKLHFGTAEEQDIEAMSLEQAKSYLAENHFAAGSMKPKIEAAVKFLEDGGREVVITLPERIMAALEDETGTHIYP
jgi:carbamate kinase